MKTCSSGNNTTVIPVTKMPCYRIAEHLKKWLKNELVSHAAKDCVMLVQGLTWVSIFYYTTVK